MKHNQYIQWNGVGGNEANRIQFGDEWSQRGLKQRASRLHHIEDPCDPHCEVALATLMQLEYKSAI